MYKTGDKVTVPDPDGNGRIAATFLNGAVPEPGEIVGRA
jgi:hypothetical protein